MDSTHRACNSVFFFFLLLGALETRAVNRSSFHTVLVTIYVAVFMASVCSLWSSWIAPGDFIPLFVMIGGWVTVFIFCILKLQGVLGKREKRVLVQEKLLASFEADIVKSDADAIFRSRSRSCSGSSDRESDHRECVENS